MRNIFTINLQCERITNPIGISTAKPRFSFTPVHNERNQYISAYQIICSTSKKHVLDCIGDMWDSGKVSSGQNYNIIYSGNGLSPFTKYYWRAKWWDKNGKESELSEISEFETGMFRKEDFSASWISKDNCKKFRSRGTVLSGQFLGDYEQSIAPYFRKDFITKGTIKRAKAYISGLGYYELRINGQKIGNNVLDPSQTDYQVLALYTVYDITNLVKEMNAIGIVLGNGRHIEYYGFGELRFYLEVHLEYEDGKIEKIISDNSWKSSHGPLTENSIYNGEKYDARLEIPEWDCFGYEDSSWESVHIVNGPELMPQLLPAIQVTKNIKPIKIIKTDRDTFVYDFGQNFSGWVRLRANGPVGNEIKLRFAENIFEDGRLNTLPNEKAESTDIYILKGEGVEVYEPKFTYHGFRYVEVSGYPGVPDLSSITGCFIHSAVSQTGEFYCSNDLINKIHTNTLWGQLSNLMSVPTDCCQRDERQGWMGDAHLSAEAAICNFDMYHFYKKYLYDIKISQKEDGSIPDVVPPYYRHLYPADPGWGAAYIILVWLLYKYYDDKEILLEHYDSLKRYIEFMKRVGINHIQKNLGKYGDWCPPGSVPPKMTTPEFTATWFYYHDTYFLALIALELGNTNDHIELTRLAVEIKDAFNSEYLSEDMYLSLSLVKTERHPSQTSHALPLYLDMPPVEKKEKILEKLLYSVIKRNDYHVDTGIIGTRYLLETLSEYGYFDVAYKIATQKSYPSWGYMISEGATTLWERWEKLTGQSMNSHNHIMFGSIDAWFYKYIAGLSPKKPGWKELQIKPNIPENLKFASAKTNSPFGEISVSWTLEKDSFILVCNIPVGASAEIHFPFEKALMQIKNLNNADAKHADSQEYNFSLIEGGNVIVESHKFKHNSDIQLISLNQHEIIVHVNSGHYKFELL